jgi:hypothetical protein
VHPNGRLTALFTHTQAQDAPMANLDFIRPTLIHKRRWVQLHGAFDEVWYQNKFGCL